MIERDTKGLVMVVTAENKCFFGVEGSREDNHYSMNAVVGRPTLDHQGGFQIVQILTPYKELHAVPHQVRQN